MIPSERSRPTGAADPRVFFIYERYDDEAACQAHIETEHFKRHGVEDAFARLADKRREIYEAIA